MQIHTKKEFIFSADEITAACHASTVLPLDDGNVLAALFGGAKEGDASVEIYISMRGTDGIWEKPRIVSENDGVPHWNPVLHLRQDGTILLFYKYGFQIDNWVTHVVSSKDGGQSWSQPSVLVPGDDSGGRGPVKNKCLRLSDGTLLAPSSTEQNRKWNAFIDRSEDDGVTWTKSPAMDRPLYKGRKVGLIQPTLWQDDLGIVHALMRSNKGAVYKSDSADNGITWNTPYRTGLPNNNSGIDCAKDDEGRIWLLYNPVKENWGDRYPLTLAVSTDNGNIFLPVCSPETAEGEYSYPAIVCRGNRLYFTYTYNRKQIVYSEIDINTLFY